eukprot:COSAG06_NODE_775_length_12397_cov_15.034071_7_plen_60_part_00
MNFTRGDRWCMAHPRGADGRCGVFVAVPSSQKKCFLGSKDAKAKNAVPNSHGTSKVVRK